MTLAELIHTFLTDDRLARFRAVASQRLGCLTMVLENCGEPHNENACIRVADSFGIGVVHRLHSLPYRRNEQISMHADRWVEVRDFDRRSELLEVLEEGGFTLVGAVVSTPNAAPYRELELPDRTALVFGGERFGLTPDMRAACDHWVTIPTFGFVDSLNLSTAAAILTQDFGARYRTRPDCACIGREEQERLLRAWVVRDLRRKLRKRGMEHLLEAALENDQ